MNEEVWVRTVDEKIDVEPYCGDIKTNEINKYRWCPTEVICMYVCTSVDDESGYTVGYIVSDRYTVSLTSMSLPSMSWIKCTKIKQCIKGKKKKKEGEHLMYSSACHTSQKYNYQTGCID